MLNLFQHLIKSAGYETLKQVQGDSKRLFTSSSNNSVMVIQHPFYRPHLKPMNELDSEGPSIPSMAKTPAVVPLFQ